MAQIFLIICHLALKIFAIYLKSDNYLRWSRIFTPYGIQPRKI